MTTGPFPVGFTRRALDLLVAGTLVLLSAPVLLVAMLLVWLLDGRPVFFHQTRIGEGARPFRLAKLRTMQVADGPAVTAAGDARVTRIGRVLRRTSIDELPQLWQVLRGRMTLVGPRPESAALAARYPVECRPVLAARPGLTGPTQLRYRERTAVPPDGWDSEEWYLRVLVPLRTAADLEYLRRPTLPTTLHHLLVTAGFVLGLVDVQVAVVPPPAVGGQPAVS